MIMLNTLDGSPVKTVRATITIEVDVIVGGTDDEDRKDSVREMLDDHFHDIRESSWFKDSLQSMKLDKVEIDDVGMAMLYHVTDPKNVQSIMEHGLLRSHDGRTSAFVFLSERPDSWLKDGLALLGVNVSGLECRMTKPCIGRDTDEICAWGDIPPERIIVIKEN